MNARFDNPWFDAMLEQMWVYRQVTDVVAKTVGPDLQHDPQALTDRCLHPSEPRLNPLEFHGKRRPVAPRVTATPKKTAVRRHQAFGLKPKLELVPTLTSRSRSSSAS